MAEEGTHFWFMTIERLRLNQRAVYNCHGTITPHRSETRDQIFYRLRSLAEEKFPDAVGGVVVSFDIQRNKL